MHAFSICNTALNFHVCKLISCGFIFSFMLFTLKQAGKVQGEGPQSLSWEEPSPQISQPRPARGLLPGTQPRERSPSRARPWPRERQRTWEGISPPLEEGVYSVCLSVCLCPFLSGFRCTCILSCRGWDITGRWSEKVRPWTYNVTTSTVIFPMANFLFFFSLSLMYVVWSEYSWSFKFVNLVLKPVTV